MIIQLSDNPRDHGLPSDFWYENQKSAALMAVNSPARVRVMEMPTGSGKSFLPAIMSRFGKTTAMVATRDLQMQYAESFDWFKVVWGQAHYPCIQQSRIALFKEMYGEPPRRDDCRSVAECPVKHSCPYEVAVAEGFNADARILNYAYGFWTKWWTRVPDQHLFLDEAHALPVVLSSLITIEIDERTRRRYSLPKFPFVSGNNKRAITEAVAWLEKAVIAMQDWKRLASRISGGDERQARRWQMLDKKLKGLQENLRVVDSGEWYVSSGMSIGRILIRPIIPARFAYRILTSSAMTYTLLSATIGDPQVLCRELGLSKESMDTVSLPHIFPKKHRPILFLSSSPRISSKTAKRRPNDYEHQADLMARVLRAHKAQKGLIHVQSWVQAERIMRLLTARGFGDRLFLTRAPKGTDRLDKIEEFKQSDAGTVAVTPSWKEGLNFPDDEARFCIIAKIPYLSLADPVTNIRLKSAGGRAWFDWRAALGVVQAAGRIVRHKDDWGITYIVDGNWPRVARLAPKWFDWNTV